MKECRRVARGEKAENWQQEVLKAAQMHRRGHTHCDVKKK